MHTVRELLAEKSHRALVYVGPDDTVFEAVTRMVHANVGAILVMDGNRVRGIMTNATTCASSPNSAVPHAIRRCWT